MRSLWRSLRRPRDGRRRRRCKRREAAWTRAWRGRGPAAPPPSCALAAAEPVRRP